MPYFQAFQPFSVTVTFFMNSITFVMNHLFSYFDISICHSSNRTLSYRLLLTHGFNHGYVLGARATLVPTCYLLSIKVSIYRESWHFSINPCQYKIIETNRFLMFAVSNCSFSLFNNLITSSASN